MGLAHGNSVGGNSQRSAQCSYRNFKGGVALGIGGQILLAVHDHVVVVGAAPHDGGGHLALCHGQGSGAFHGGAAGAALQHYGSGVCAVCGGLDGLLGLGLGVAHAHDMVVPLALGAKQRQLEVGIQCFYRDVVAVHFLSGAVCVGNRVHGGDEPCGLVGLGIGGKAGVEVHDLFGSQTDVEGHHAVFHGQCALAVAGFIGVEHTAVGLEISGIYAIRQGSFGHSRGSHHGRSNRACRSRGGGDSPAAACQRSSQHHTGQRNDDKLFATHKINTSVS